MGGSSLDQNPPNADRHITAGGSDWLWAVFAVMILSDLGMIFWSFTASILTRLFTLPLELIVSSSGREAHAYSTILLL
ncbi:hypothetical protein PHLCEN_2v6541 [Hermanssonia centrifuga]|uniref:Uncharacterized protein n=1 Tax=Hermanssonia centrifuga TaxID=98765 RepID=A0A2R6NZ44_9APHY|nr:hypothetical protein PHLCEN_2v6541 [Hermanssonia centrifuga]